MSQRWSLLPLGVLAACATEGKVTPALSAITDGDAPFQASVLSTVAVGGAQVTARVTNTYGVAVPAGAVRVTVVGAGVSTTVDLPATSTGYPSAVVDGTVPGAAAVTITDTEDGVELANPEGTAWVLGQDLPPVAMPRLGFLPLTADQTPTFAVPATDGVVLAVGDQLWFRPSDPSAQPAPLADMPFDIAGLQSGHIDNDGVLDLLVWSGSVVAVLRGHEGGQFTWKSGWQADFGAVVGAVLSDVNSDRLLDLSVGVSGEDRGQVQMLLGDGSWGFDEIDPLVVNGEFYDLASGDERADGQPDASVISVGSGTIRRYTFGEKGWQGAPTSELAGYQAGPGASLMPLADLDGDLDDEVIMLSNPEANTQDLVFYVVGDDEGSTSINYELSWGRFFAELADMNADGVLDVVGLDDGVLHVVRWLDEQFTDETVAGFGAPGPIAAEDWNRDGVNDIAVVTQAVAFHDGVLDADSGSWTRSRGGWQSVNTALVGDLLALDVSADGVSDLVAFTNDGDQLALATWLVSEGEGGRPSFTFADSVSMGVGAVPLGLVHCAPNTFALVETAEGPVLHRVGITVLGAMAEPSGPIDVDGTLLACGALPDGESGVVVAQTSGFWSAYASSLVARSSGNVDAVNAIDLADTDGDGATEVVGCIGEGCSVAVVPMDGGDAVLRSEGTVSVTIGGARADQLGGGRLVAADVDNDGQPDVLGWDELNTRLSLYRAAGGAIAPAAGYHADYGLVGRPAVGDLNADGRKELLFRDAGGILWISPVDGAL